MKSMHEFFKIGDVIDGLCNGYFGRDDYETKKCVFVTNKYAVFEYTKEYNDKFGKATVLNNPDLLDKELVSSWKT